MCPNNWLAYGESFVLNHFGDLKIIFYVFLVYDKYRRWNTITLWFLFLYIRSPSLFYFSFLFLIWSTLRPLIPVLRRFVIGISFLAVLYREFIQSPVNIVARGLISNGVVLLLKIIFLVSIYIFVSLYILISLLRKRVAWDWKRIS